MEMDNTSLPPAKQLEALIEVWYAWLTSEPNILFGVQDLKKLRDPVSYFHQSNEWLSRTTMLNTEWFFREGSDIVMNRWKKGELDSYE